MQHVERWQISVWPIAVKEQVRFRIESISIRQVAIDRTENVADEKVSVGLQRATNVPEEPFSIASDNAVHAVPSRMKSNGTSGYLAPFNTLPTVNEHATPSESAFSLAQSIAVGEMSIPYVSKPCFANQIAMFPAPQPSSRSSRVTSRTRRCLCQGRPPVSPVFHRTRWRGLHVASMKAGSGNGDRCLQRLRVPRRSQRSEIGREPSYESAGRSHHANV